MNPVALTAFYTCGIRAADAASAAPVVGDGFAARCMTAEGAAVVAHMRALRKPWQSVLARHRRIDDRVRAALAADPDLLVVVLGAGFDSRAWRLGGGRWLEIDDAALIAFKEQRLPQHACPRPLTRVAVDFSRNPLSDVLAPWRQPVHCLVILEGVLMYLDQDQIRATAQALRTLAPAVTVLYDHMSPTFVRRAGQAAHRRLQALGAPFRMQDTDSAGAWREAGFAPVRALSIPLAMAELGMAPLTGWLLRTPLLRWLREGYQLLEVRRSVEPATGEPPAA